MRLPVGIQRLPRVALHHRLFNLAALRLWKSLLPESLLPHQDRRTVSGFLNESETIAGSESERENGSENGSERGRENEKENGNENGNENENENESGNGSGSDLLHVVERVLRLDRVAIETLRLQQDRLLPTAMAMATLPGLLPQVLLVAATPRPQYRPQQAHPVR